MSASLIQAEYEQLEAVAARFGQQAEANARLVRHLEQRASVLIAGSWQGRGVAAFAAEMETDVLPTARRLSDALQEGQRATVQISAILRAAEEEAAEPFRNGGNRSMGPSGGNDSGEQTLENSDATGEFNPNITPHNMGSGRDDDGDGFPDIPYYQLDMDIGGVFNKGDWSVANMDSMYTMMRELDTNGRPVIFAIHGYNVSDEAAGEGYRSFVDSIHEKYGHLPPGQRPVVIGVNWDGGSNMLRYNAANSNAENTGRYLLGGLMKTYYRHHPESSINVVAHSLGNRLVMAAIGDGGLKINHYIAMEAAVGTGDNNIQANYAGVLDSSVVRQMTITHTNWDLPLNLHQGAQILESPNIIYDGIDFDPSTRPRVSIDINPVAEDALSAREEYARRVVDSRLPGSTTLIDIGHFTEIGLNHPSYTNRDVLDHVLGEIMPPGIVGWDDGHDI